MPYHDAMIRLALICLTTTVVTLIGCATLDPPQKGLIADNPSRLLEGIRLAGAQRDTTKVPLLVEQLDNDDPAVRVFAIHALDQITGERLGYNPYDPPMRRAQAIGQWVQAVNDARFDEGP